MCWGALSTGARAATGSTGQGLSLMQESFAEITLAELPLVIFNMARGQSDYFQATRGGGHGDYRHLVLAPHGRRRSASSSPSSRSTSPTSGATPCSSTATSSSRTATPRSTSSRSRSESLAPKDWAVDGTTSGTGRARLVTSLGIGKVHQRRPGHRGALPGGGTAHRGDRGRRAAARGGLRRRRRRRRGRVRLRGQVRAQRGARSARRRRTRRIRPARSRSGRSRTTRCTRPPTGTRGVMVFENSAGQLIDDVKIAVEGAAPVVGIGGVSTDSSGFGVGRSLRRRHHPRAASPARDRHRSPSRE